MLAFWGSRRVTIVAFGVAIGSNALLFWVRAVEIIGLFTFVSGFATSILVTAVLTLIRAQVPASFRGRALAGVGGALRFGMLLGPAAGGMIAEQFGVPMVFLLRATLLLAGAISFAAGTLGTVTPYRNDHSIHTPKEAETAEDRLGARVLAPLKPVIRGLQGRWYAVGTVGFGILILSILRSSREVILPLWGAHLELSVAEIGLAMSLGAGFDLLLFIPAGVISDKWGRKVSAALCLALFSLGLLLLLPSRSFLLFVLAGALIGIGNGFGAGINMTTGADLAPSVAVSQFLGLWRLYGDLGSALGPVLVGTLSAAITLGPTVAVTALLGGLGLAVVLFLAPETKSLPGGGR